MRRTLGLAALAVAASALVLPSAPASACDPNSFPYCMTYCKALVYQYEELGQWINPSPPPVPRTGLAGCP